jgi:hypothetical protein
MIRTCFPEEGKNCIVPDIEVKPTIEGIRKGKTGCWKKQLKLLIIKTWK